MLYGYLVGPEALKRYTGHFLANHNSRSTPPPIGVWMAVRSTDAAERRYNSTVLLPPPNSPQLLDTPTEKVLPRWLP